MTEQLMLSAFSQKTISLEKATKDFRPWNNLIYDWEVEYRGYARGDEDEPEGFMDFHVIVEVVEALVDVRDTRTYKKVKQPGYKLIVSQNISFKDEPWDSYIVFDESFQKDQLKKAFDVFQRELLNIQSWITIAESRANLIPKRIDVFECFHCGWVTDIWADDIMCQGCGKRYWSERLRSVGNSVGDETLIE